MFLMHEGQLGADHVDRDADAIEHHLTRDTVAELERLLRVHGREPELPPSVHPVGA
jgi:Mn-dependent DtxR family transcriptional regulator